jgi:hypothetical protein
VTVSASAAASEFDIAMTGTFPLALRVKWHVPALSAEQIPPSARPQPIDFERPKIQPRSNAKICTNLSCVRRHRALCAACVQTPRRIAEIANWSRCDRRARQDLFFMQWAETEGD